MPEVKYHRICHERKSKRVCIFSTYDEDSVVQDYVLHCLSEIKRYGFEVIFVSTSEVINECDEKKVAKFSSNIVIRENEGYDFTSWKVGTKYISWDIAETILFLNDSIIFPLYDFADELESMVQSGIDFLGLIDSQSNGHFINSFFWLFNKRIVESEWFVEYCNGIPVESKKFYVEKYETKIIDELQANGFTYDTFIKCENIYEKRGFKDFKEYTHYRLFWDKLITDYEAPFLKKNILNNVNKEKLIYAEHASELFQGSKRFFECVCRFFSTNIQGSLRNTNLLISYINEWIVENVAKDLIIYGDNFTSNMMYYLARRCGNSKLENVSQIIISKNNILDLKEVSQKHLSNNDAIIIIPSFSNFTEVSQKIDKILKGFKNKISLESIFENNMHYLNYFENLSLNIKYCKAFAQINYKTTTLIVHEDFKELYQYCMKDESGVRFEASAENFFFCLDCSNHRYYFH